MDQLLTIGALRGEFPDYESVLVGLPSGQHCLVAVQPSSTPSATRPAPWPPFASATAADAGTFNVLVMPVRPRNNETAATPA
jgi:hypothetical protein